MNLLVLTKKFVLTIIYEIIWCFYTVFIVVPLPLIVKIKKKGKLCKPPYILCSVHVGNFDPLLITRASKIFRVRAMYQVDGPYPFLRFFYKSIWRFRVSQDPKIKKEINSKTVDEIVNFLKNDGRIMIFPEGYWNWQKILYSGVAEIAHKADVPIIPVGIENGYTFKPELDKQPPLRAIKRIFKDYKKLKEVTVHYGSPIYPDQSLEEEIDVKRVMKIIQNKFDDYYKKFYNIAGPKLHDKN
jgi:1-acyl-sn-glycerol-3-phosphate acyltransferase